MGFCRMAALVIAFFVLQPLASAQTAADENALAEQAKRLIAEVKSGQRQVRTPQEKVALLEALPVEGASEFALQRIEQHMLNTRENDRVVQAAHRAARLLGHAGAPLGNALWKALDSEIPAADKIDIATTLAAIEDKPAPRRWTTLLDNADPMLTKDLVRSWKRYVGNFDMTSALIEAAPALVAKDASLKHDLAATFSVLSPEPTAIAHLKLPPVVEDKAALTSQVLAILKENNGDANLGRSAFTRAGCIACHTIEGGDKVGPTLQGIGRRETPEHLLESILHPSKIIADFYTAESVETNDGDFYVGFVNTSDDGKALHITTAASPIVVPANTVKARKTMKSSLMPEALEKGQSPAELADLVAYVHSLKAGGPDSRPGMGIPSGPDFRLAKGDRIVFVGNTFAERLHRSSHFETMLAAKFSDHDLTFRNMGWSADTLTLQPRPLNFGDISEHLAKARADVIFACFGMNESFDGPEGLARFEQDWHEYLNKHLSQRYNGKTSPRIVLVSPIAHELIDGLADPRPHNENLKAYTQVMRRVAEQRRLPFVDLFTPTWQIMHASAGGSGPPRRKLTINGIHLNDYGNWLVAQIMLQQLFPNEKPWRMGVDGSGRENMKILAREFPRLTPLPEGVKPEEAVLDYVPVLAVKSLKPGKYTLMAQDQSVLTATHKAWEQGIPLLDTPFSQQAGGMYKVIDEKNEQFFYRWRAVNGEYIYGRRKAPFGIVNFPKEMEYLDNMILGMDREIWSLSKLPKDQHFELIREKE